MNIEEFSEDCVHDVEVDEQGAMTELHISDKWWSTDITIRVIDGDVDVIMYRSQISDSYVTYTHEETVETFISILKTGARIRKDTYDERIRVLGFDERDNSVVRMKNGLMTHKDEADVDNYRAPQSIDVDLEQSDLLAVFRYEHRDIGYVVVSLYSTGHVRIVEPHENPACVRSGVSRLLEKMCEQDRFNPRYLDMELAADMDLSGKITAELL